MSEAQERALQWLRDRGGSGVIDRHGRVAAAFERAEQAWSALAVGFAQLGEDAADE